MADNASMSKADELVAQVDTGARNPLGWARNLIPIICFIWALYQLYKYDYYTDSEKDDVQTYYLSLDYSPAPRWVLDVSYQFEDDDFGDYHRVEVGAKYVFGKNNAY